MLWVCFLGFVVFAVGLINAVLLSAIRVLAVLG